MLQIYLTRAQYDALLSSQPNWVRGNWTGLGRRWSIGGVTVTCQTENQLAVLAAHVARSPGSSVAEALSY